MKFPEDEFREWLDKDFPEYPTLNEMGEWGFEQAKKMMLKKIKEIDKRALHEAWGTYEYTKALEQELRKK